MNAAAKSVVAPMCPYCGNPSVFMASSAPVYGGRDFGPIYNCSPCDARVGCHKQSLLPLGRLANAELRKAKQAVHGAFDPLWKNVMSAYDDPGAPPRVLLRIGRTRAYQWLAHHLHIRFDDCHVGMFDLETCHRTVALIYRYRPTPKTVREWAKARRAEDSR